MRCALFVQFWALSNISIQELKELNAVFALRKGGIETSIHTEIMTSMSSVEDMALAELPFLPAKQILGAGLPPPPQPALSENQAPLTVRAAKVTQLITLCHCVPGCPSISVSLLCVKHDWDNSKSQTFSRRKNKADIFQPLKQTANILIFRSARPPLFKERKFWRLMMLCPTGTLWHFVAWMQKWKHLCSHTSMLNTLKHTT